MDVYIGTIYMWAPPFAPPGSWACNGATIRIDQNAALFSLLGTIYGGTGISDFQIPDLIGCMPIGSVTLGGYARGRRFNFNSGDEGDTQDINVPVKVSCEFSLADNNLPGHIHPASFDPTIGKADITVSAPAVDIPVTIPVGAKIPQSGPPPELGGDVYLTNASAGVLLKGLYSGVAAQPEPSVSVLGASASGNPGGSFTGSVETVTGGVVTVRSQRTGPPLPVRFIATGKTEPSPAPLPPFLAIGFVIAALGVYPPRP